MRKAKPDTLKHALSAVLLAIFCFLAAGSFDTESSTTSNSNSEYSGSTSAPRPPAGTEEKQKEYSFEASEVSAKNLGVSYDQVMEGISNLIEMKPPTPSDGQLKYTGSTFDALARLEITGDKRFITRASLMLTLPGDNPEILSRNVDLMLQFLENTCPDWAGSATWANNASAQFAAGTSTKESIVLGLKRVSMVYQGEKEIEKLIVTVEPSGTQNISKAQLQELQSLLNKLGYNAGQADGILGPKTVKAINAFLRDSGLPVDDDISDALLKQGHLKENAWYEGGTLHNSTAAEWHKATKRNQLATAADFAAKLNVATDMESLLLRATELKSCITHATDDERLYELEIPFVASMCALQLGY